MLKTKIALAGNRTPVSRVTGVNSTTKPPMLVTQIIYPAQSHIKYCIHVKNKSRIGGESNPGLRMPDETSTTEQRILVKSPIFPAQSHI